MTETVRRGVATDSVMVIGRPAPPDITADLTVGAGFEAVLSSSVRALRHVSHRTEQDRPEVIHRFRVGLRRLRSLISAFSKILPEEERRALGARLGALGKQYSRVREWDVFIASSLGPMARSLPDEPALLELEACARDARQRALPPSVDFAAAADDIAAAIDSASWLHTPQAELSELWHSNLRDFASDLLRKRHRRLRKRLKAVDLDQQSSFHELRIQAKKIRYPIEMFKDIFDSEQVESYLRRVIAVQDALGHLNDALIARELIADLPLSSRPQGLANGWLAREIELCRQRFPAAAKKLRKATPFWDEK